MRSFGVLTPLLALTTLAFAQSDNCVGEVATSADRKVAIVIDSSWSNLDTDPHNLRILGGKRIVSNLGTSDQVAVIDFDTYARVVSKLGPASKATFRGIDSDGGTCIFCGVEEALWTLQGATPNTAGIVVFTDGQDSDVVDLVTQIDIATSLGVRVSFGFLSEDGSSQDPSVVAAIQRNGGTFANIDNAEAQANFVSLVLASGLVNDDATTGATLLLPGVRVSGNVSVSSTSAIYQYNAIANETLNFTVTAVTSGVSFDGSLKNNGKEVGKFSTDSVTGFGSIGYTAGDAAENLTLDLSTTNTAGGLFQIALGSSSARTFSVCAPTSSNGTESKSTVESSMSSTFFNLTQTTTTQSYTEKYIVAGALLLRGVFTEGFVRASSKAASYQYNARAYEVLSIIVTTVTPGVSFDGSLKKNGKVVGNFSTDILMGFGSISYIAGGAAEYELDISTTNTTGGSYQVSLGSSVNQTISAGAQSWSNSTVQNGTVLSTNSAAAYNLSQTITQTYTESYSEKYIVEAGAALLIKDVMIHGNCSASSSAASYQYNATASEVLNITVTAITSGVFFDGSLKKDGKEVGSFSTDVSMGCGYIIYTTGSNDENLTLDITTTNTTGGFYEIELGTSVKITAFEEAASNTTEPNGTAAPTISNPKQTGNSVFTGAASMIKGVVAVAAIPLLFALAL